MKDAKIFVVAKWIMLLAGTWELELIGVSKIWRRIYKFYCIGMFIIYHTCHLSLFLKFIEVWGVDTNQAVECLSLLIILFLSGIKMLLCRSKQMTKVLKNAIAQAAAASTDDDECIKNIVSNYTRYAIMLGLSITGLSFFIGSLLLTETFLEQLQMKKEHNSLQEYKERPLPISYWYPFEFENYYGSVFCYEMFTIYLSDLYNSGVHSLLQTIEIQIIVDIKILQYRFCNFTKDTVTGYEADQEKAYLNLRECIKTHQKLIKLTEELDKALQSTLLIEYAVSSVSLAAVLVQIISGKKPVFNSLYFGLLAYQWFMLSWNANEIKLQSEDLSMFLYKSNWHVQSKATNQLIYLILLRNKKPLCLHIGPFGEMTINAAISRFKLAYSYVSLMS